MTNTRFDVDEKVINELLYIETCEWFWESSEPDGKQPNVEVSEVEPRVEGGREVGSFKKFTVAFFPLDTPIVVVGGGAYCGGGVAVVSK